MNALYNKKNKAELLNQLKSERFGRVTLSFYKYVNINNPIQLRDEMYSKLNDINVLGRIYIAEEGINAQISVPDDDLDTFKKIMYSYKNFNDIKLKTAVSTAFCKAIEPTSFSAMPPSISTSSVPASINRKTS